MLSNCSLVQVLEKLNYLKILSVTKRVNILRLVGDFSSILVKECDHGCLLIVCLRFILCQGSIPLSKKEI